MSDEKATRDFEKRTLSRVLEDLCAPGDHHPDCPRRSNVCPHAERGER